ncbi:MAG: RNA polymerase sigma factor [bacterium]|nr:RNA polymerase sigma factor [bacterium]
MNNTREQFSSIYDQYIEKIYRFVYLKVSSQEIAEDLTSKVFLKGWEAYQKSKRGIINPGAFLYQIARNTVIDHYREKGKTNIVSTENVPQIADPGANLQDMAMLSSDVSIVKTAIQKLKKDYQDVIIWHYLEDMPIATLADIMGKPAGTIRVMLHRGLKELKGEIGSLDVKES